MKFEIDLKFRVGQKAYFVFVPTGRTKATIEEVTIIDMEFTCLSVANGQFTRAVCLIESKGRGRTKTNDCWLFLTDMEAGCQADILNDRIRECGNDTNRLAHLVSGLMW